MHDRDLTASDDAFREEYSMINAEEFLAHVLPSEGLRCCTTIVRKGEKKIPKNHHFATNEEAVTFSIRNSGIDVYIACGTFKTSESRKQANVTALKAFWLDVDCGPEKDYTDKKAGAEAVVKFCRETGLPIPTMVISGGGIHCWWGLTEAISPDRWYPAAVLLKHMTEALGFKVDPARTADHASVLRLPGTNNWKEAQPRPVYCKKLQPQVDTNAFLGLLSQNRLGLQVSNAAFMSGIKLPPDMKQGYSDGARTDALLYRAGYCLGPWQMSEEDAIAACLAWNQHNNPPLGEEKVKSTVRNIAAREIGSREARGQATLPDEPPRPLRRRMVSAEPYPVEALGPRLQSAVVAIHEITAAPLAICAQSVLAAATLVVQAYANVELPTKSIRPLSGFFVTLAASGERKSAVDSLALKAVHAHEQNLRAQYDIDMVSYKNLRAAWDRARATTLTKYKTDFISCSKELATLGPEPQAPLRPILVCPEPTFEGITKLWEAGHASLGMFSAEGGQFIGGHAMGADNKLKTAAGLSSVWDGEPVRRVRAGDGAAILPGRRLAMHLMVQNRIGSEFLADPMLTDQGLLSRVLIVAPDTTAGTRFFRQPSAESHAAVDAYATHMLAILSSPEPLASGKLNELKPPMLPLSAGATPLWIEYVNEVELQLGPEGLLYPIAGLGNKLPEHAARLAAVRTLVENLKASEIPAECMAAGIELARYYSGEALRVFGAGYISPDISLAEALLTWLKKRAATTIAAAEIYQNGPSGIRDKDTTLRIMRILEEHGYVRRLPPGTKIGGKQRKEAWEIMVAKAED